MKKFMITSLTINPYSFHTLSKRTGVKLDLTDMALYAFLTNQEHFSGATRINYAGKVYFMVTHNFLKECFPSLGLSTGASVRYHISRLESVGLIEACPNNVGLKKSFYRICDNMEMITCSDSSQDVEETPAPDPEPKPSPRSERKAEPEDAPGLFPAPVQEAAPVTDVVKVEPVAVDVPKTKETRFKEYMANFPSIQKMQCPMTMEQLIKLCKTYGKEDVFNTLTNMENQKKPLVYVKYKSAYLTCNNWLRMSRERSGGSSNASANRNKGMDFYQLSRHCEQLADESARLRDMGVPQSPDEIYMAKQAEDIRRYHEEQAMRQQEEAERIRRQNRN